MGKQKKLVPNKTEMCQTKFQKEPEETPSLSFVGKIFLTI